MSSPWPGGAELSGADTHVSAVGGAQLTGERPLSQIAPGPGGSGQGPLSRDTGKQRRPLKDHRIPARPLLGVHGHMLIMPFNKLVQVRVFQHCLLWLSWRGTVMSTSKGNTIGKRKIYWVNVGDRFGSDRGDPTRPLLIRPPLLNTFMTGRTTWADKKNTSFTTPPSGWLRN